MKRTLFHYLYLCNFFLLLLLMKVKNQNLSFDRVFKKISRDFREKRKDFEQIILRTLHKGCPIITERGTPIFEQKDETRWQLCRLIKC